jgi:glucose/arabinose dehydrogenase
MGDEIPPCELNVVEEAGQHFGFPYCHGGDIPDPKYGANRPCADFVAPAWRFAAHVAPLGMDFYSGNLFPSTYKNKIFVAQHGSWNRSRKVGYRVMVMEHDGTKATSAKPFAYGWLNAATQRAWGRPVDVITMKDGSLLVSDDYAGVIYRISYEG